MKQRKLYVITGFLGAGKTSILLHLLNHIQDQKVGVIQNEFGKLGIDGPRMERSGMELIEISSGSIFCSCLKLHFVQALAELGKKDLDCVFVESSGLADPSNMDEILGAVRLLVGDVYRFEGAICLIDGVNFLQQLSDTETVNRQLAHCHMAVVNKTDLIDQNKLEEVTAAVRKVNPICQLLTCENGKVSLDFLKQDLTSHRWAECEASTNSVDNKPKTISLECQEPVSRQELAAFLQRVLADCYRIKGSFQLRDGWYQVDVVEKRVDFKPGTPRERSQLVFLSKIGPQVIRTVDQAWRELVSAPMKLRN